MRSSRVQEFKSLGVGEFEVRALWTAIGQRAASFSSRGLTKKENAARHERPRKLKLAAREIHESDESRPTGSERLDNLAEEQL